MHTLFATLSWQLIILLLVHAALVAFAALRLERRPARDAARDLSHAHRVDRRQRRPVVNHSGRAALAWLSPAVFS